MPSTTTNRLFAVGLGLTTVAVVGLMRHMLLAYRDSIKVKEPKAVTQYITQDTENALKEQTLDKLIDSHNQSIQELAARIICDRTLHDAASMDYLLWELTRSDGDRREQASRALHLLAEQPNMSQLNSPKVYQAIVACLALCTQASPHTLYNGELDDFDFWEPAERISVLVLMRMIPQYSAFEVGPQIVKAGVVERWLAKQPWGNTDTEVLENFKNCWETKRNISYIMKAVAKDPTGLEKLVQAKLISTSDTDFFPKDEIMTDEVIDLAVPWCGTEAVEEPGGLRTREQSAEERHLRRRHREAMVLNDGVQPISGGDIIERDDTLDDPRA